MERWKQKIDRQRRQDRRPSGIIAPYLSAANRDNPGESCPVAAFAGDMCHETAESGLHQTYTKASTPCCRSLTPLMGADSPKSIGNRRWWNIR